MKKSIKSMIDKLIKTGFIHIFGASSLNQVLSLLSGIVLVRVLSKSDYGVFSYAFNIYQFFLICSGMGIVSGILQMCSEFSDKPDISDSIYQWSSGFGIQVNIVM
ncbi:MAG: oligosaccharide flippase family protein, partial [Raoultibacter sp.]